MKNSEIRNDNLFQNQFYETKQYVIKNSSLLTDSSFSEKFISRYKLHKSNPVMIDFQTFNITHVEEDNHEEVIFAIRKWI